jgi:uncharacterized protein (TIGR03435 family)
MTSKKNKLEELLRHLDSSAAMQQRMPDAVRERILNNVIKETNDPEVEAPRKSDSAHPAMDLVRRHHRWQWPAAAAALAAIAMAVILPTRILQGAPAVLEDAEGKRDIQYGELVRPAGDRSAMLSMRDGSRVETRSMSEFSLERMDDGGTRIRLKEGGLIVDASAKNQASLSVQTKDITALVGGAVSLVNAEEEGSRIAAIGGEIHVQQGTTEKRLRPGEQVATSPRMELVPMKEEVAWSRQAVEHMAMLEQAQSSLSVQQVTPPKPPTPPARGKLEFAATSIKVMPPATRMPSVGLACHGTDGVQRIVSVIAPGLQDGVNAPLGRCVGNGIFLSTMIELAYGVAPRDISGGPDWSRTIGSRVAVGSRGAGVTTLGVVGSRGDSPNFGWARNESFQIEAVTDDPTHTTLADLREMLRNVLADRFKLQFHREQKQVPGYSMVIAEGGSKMKAVSGDYVESLLVYQGRSTLDKLARTLSLFLPGGPVIDKTGLSGAYEYSIEGSPPLAPQVNPGTRGGSAGPDERVKYVNSQMEEKLGLRLQPEKSITVETIVIDSVEPPTPN